MVDLTATVRVALASLAVPLIAADAAADGAYVELQAGPSFFADSELSNGGTADLRYDTGYHVGGAAGARFLDVARAELGVHYRNADADELDLGFASPSISGDVGVVSIMANGYLDVDFWEVPVVPYVGAGLGVGVVLVDLPGLDEEEGEFAYNVMGGLAFDLNEHWVARAGYRYFATTDVEVEGIEAELDIHELVFGLRYEF